VVGKYVVEDAVDPHGDTGGAGGQPAGRVVRCSGRRVAPIRDDVNAAGVLFAVAIGILLGVLASLLPARQAARLDIVRALQYE